MRSNFAVLVALALLAVSAGARAQGSAADVYFTEMNAIADALESVHDDASARAAAAAMGAALARLAPVVDEINAWPASAKRDFAIGRARDIQAAQLRVSAGLSRLVQNPQYLELFATHMQNLPRIE